MTVTVASDCLLKAARAFLVFKAVEELGQILVYRPSSQDIEDEKFDLSFSFYVASGEGFDKLEHAASNVSEIDKVEGKEITEFHLEGEAEQTAQASEETKRQIRKKKRERLLLQRQNLQSQKLQITLKSRLFLIKSYYKPNSQSRYRKA